MVSNKILKLAVAAVTLLSLVPTAKAQGDTPVTAIANPQAVSSGSVTNQAVQVLQGPYITNSFGGGVQCQACDGSAKPQQVVFCLHRCEGVARADAVASAAAEDLLVTDEAHNAGSFVPLPS